MTVLKRTIRMQALWLVLALSYNALSWWQLDQGFVALSPTNPLIVFFVVNAIALPVIGAGLVGSNRLYFYLNWLFVFMTGSASYTHSIPLFSGDYSVYASSLSWILALLINSFGAIVGLLGAWQISRLKAVATHNLVKTGP